MAKSMRRRLRQSARLLFAFIFVYFIIHPILASATSQEQINTPETRAQNLLNRLSPEEKIGQLFLVTFKGSEVSDDSPINELIEKYHVGGIMLKASNDNFITGENAPSQTKELIKQLQSIEYLGSEKNWIEPNSGEFFRPSYIPLFIGISQVGDGYPSDQILSGLTQLPSQMAIGATWNPELSREVGETLGKELSSLGFNLIFGPSLDIVDTPHPFENSDLGASVFGGDPYWVSKLGQEYITGLHIGSNNRLAVVGTHFPGLGSSDRIPIDEVATVRKSLEQLKQIELAPFFAVTGEALTTEAKVDALLTAHIRYQGFQGNIRASTKPISFDPQAFDLLMNLLQLSSWREENGIMISDDLGVPAVKRFYAPINQRFDPRRPVLDAFLAGNDILYVGGITDSSPLSINGDLPSSTTFIDILDFFSQKYRGDQAFASRVDESVLRILTLKYKLYDFFSPSQISPPKDFDTDFGNNSQLVFEVARQSATLINPPIEELDTVLPNPPNISDKIIFFTDSFEIKPCSNCEPESNIEADALMKAIQSLYGQSASGQISNYNLSSFSFADLLKILDQTQEESVVEKRINSANWVVFLMLNADPERPQSLALQRILSERPDLLNQKNVVVFAANAPYYLDATDISKLTAYYGLFSKAPPFVEIAARLLFKEIPTPPGASPVSIPGIGYDLRSATSPNSNKPFKLYISSLSIPGTQPQENPLVNLENIEFDIFDAIQVSTDIILDHNNHPVPDHTPVQFSIVQNDHEEYFVIAETTNGIASIDVTLDQTGSVRISAVSETAFSEELTLNVIGNLSETPSITETTTNTPEPSITASPPPPTSTTIPPSQPQIKHLITDIYDWMIAVLLSIFFGLIAYRTGAIVGKVRWGIRWGLSSIIGGMLFYFLVSLNFSLSTKILSNYERWGVTIVVLIGALLGWGISLIINSILENK